MNHTDAKPKKKIHMKVLVKRGLFCCVLIYLCVLFISQQFSIARLRTKEDELDRKIAAASKEKTELEAQQEAVGTDEYLERVARDKLGYMKPEEKVFIDSSHEK